MKSVCRIVLATVAVASLATGADAAMCVKHSGVVVVRDACKKKETLLSSAQFVGEQGPAGAPGAHGEKGDPGAFRVVDSTGKLVGFVDLYYTASIVVDVPGLGLAQVYSDQDGSGIWPDDDTQLYHESNDCEGEPLASPERYPLIPYAQVFANTAYFPLRPGSTRTIKSYEFVTNTCNTFVTGRGLCCENYSSPEEQFVTRTTPVPVSQFGTPPFHVEH
jgi:hypothetical protein